MLSICPYLSGTKHKTILEARSGLGPIKAYPRLGPKPSGEQGGGPVDPNTQERTFHCEICNVRVNSELQLKQVRLKVSNLQELQECKRTTVMPLPSKENTQPLKHHFLFKGAVNDNMNQIVVNTLYFK